MSNVERADHPVESGVSFAFSMLSVRWGQQGR